VPPVAHRFEQGAENRPVCAHCLNCPSPVLQGKAAPLLNVIPTWIEKRYLDTVDGFIFNSRTTCDSVFQSQPAPALT
jgi:hypothetical protein